MGTGQATNPGNGIWSNIVSSESGINVNYIEVSNFVDGTVMTDDKLDNVIYRKKGSLYLRQALDLTKSRTLTVNTVNDIRYMSLQNIILLKLGYYDKVTTKGYYSESDGGSASYTMMESLGTDDGFLTINVVNATLSISLSLIQERFVSSKQAGVKGDGITDDTVQMQLFANSIKYLTVPPQIIGNILIKDKIIFNGGLPNGADVKITDLYFDCTFISDYTSEEEMVRFNNYFGKNLNGKITFKGKGSIPYSTRQNGVGMVLYQCGRMKVQHLDFSMFKYWGLKILDGGLSFLGKIVVTDCGTYGEDAAISGNVVSITNTGGTGSLGQRTNIELDVDFNLVEYEGFIIIRDRLHVIAGRNSANNFSIFPWVDPATIAGDSGKLILGGGVLTDGNNTSCVRIGMLDGMRCGTALRNSALYPACVDTIVTQWCGISAAMGRTMSSACVGGSIGYVYTESDKYSYVFVTSYEKTGFSLLNSGLLDPHKILSMSPALTGGGFSPQFSILPGASYTDTSSRLISPANTVFNYSPNSKDIGFQPTGQSFYGIHKDSGTLNLKAGSGLVPTLTGHDTIVVFLTGNGTNNNPISSFTISAETGYTINNLAEGDTVTLSGASYPVLLYFKLVGTKWYFTKRELKEYIAATTTNLGLVKKSASLTAAQPSATAPVAYDA
ncbi:hypothetical protein, partial [Dysgonomonas sp. 37-18]